MSGARNKCMEESSGPKRNKQVFMQEMISLFNKLNGPFIHMIPNLFFFNRQSLETK